MEDPLDSPYHYTPTRWVAIIFLVLFGLSTVLHGVQACYFRTWWLLPTAFLCGILEIVGWSGRLWSSFTPTKFPPFAMQLAFLVIGPTPLLSVNFITFEKLVKRLGPAYSRLQPKYYAIIFMSCDVLALVLQVMGGVLVSTAYTDNQADNGTIVMLAGIGFQLVVIVGFIVLSVEYFVRYFTDVPFKWEERHHEKRQASPDWQ